MQTVSYGSRTAESQVITMLKVQNRECIRRISKKSLRAGKRRNMVLCLAIALTTILMTALFTIGGSMLRAMQDATMYQVGTKSHAGFKFLTMEQYEKLLKELDAEEILKETSCLHLPYAEPATVGEYALEQLVNSEMGNFVRTLLCSEEWKK